MTKYTVLVGDNVVLTYEVEIEADNETDAIEQACELIRDEKVKPTGGWSEQMEVTQVKAGL